MRPKDTSNLSTNLSVRNIFNILNSILVHEPASKYTLTKYGNTRESIVLRIQTKRPINKREKEKKKAIGRTKREMRKKVANENIKQLNNCRNFFTVLSVKIDGACVAFECFSSTE